VSLDVFRGATIAAMLLVNDPGNWGAIYPPLRHAEWNGWTPTDLIFPFFLFIVGITTYLSLGSRRAKGASDWTIGRQILKRGSIIILLGLAFSAFPYFPLTRITNMRIPGVLQRIGITYILGAFLSIKTTAKQQVAIIAAILFGYWFLMTLVPVPGGGMGALQLDTPSATMAAWVDRWLLGGHLWNQTLTWDPEGVLSTIPAIASVMLGVLAGRWLFDPGKLSLAERLNGFFAVGAIGAVVGLMWNWSFPINKNLWTSSYVLFTAGVACMTLAVCIWIIDVQRVTWWTKPFVIFGTNAIVAYVGSEVFARLIYSLIKVPLHGKSVSLQAAIYETGFASWLAPKDASLLFAVCVVLVWFGILAILYRKRLFFKV
jgi:predicted acyltransferase